jgi:hypothetical protein
MVAVFGAVLEGQKSQLSSMWSADNEMTFEQFLTWTTAPDLSRAPEIIGKRGALVAFKVLSALFEEGQKYLLFSFSAKPRRRLFRSLPRRFRQPLSDAGERNRSTPETGVRSPTDAEWLWILIMH